MNRSLVAYELFIAAVVIERLVELVLSKRHARALLSRGATEHGRGHYPSMVLLHTLFLVGCVVEPVVTGRPFVPALGWPMLAIAIAAQAVRWWAIGTLGVFWNTRVIVLPRARRVTGGPYRFLTHPNYAAVIAEGIALPLIHSSIVTAIAFTVLNAWLLSVRIRTENAALGAMTSSHDLAAS